MREFAPSVCFRQGAGANRSAVLSPADRVAPSFEHIPCPGCSRRTMVDTLSDLARCGGCGRVWRWHDEQGVVHPLRTS